MWFLYLFVSDWTHLLMVRVGQWAMRKKHRPLLVGVVVSVVVALLVTGMLELMETVSGRQQ